MNSQLDPLFRDILNAQALRLQSEHPATATLRAMVAWHEKNADAVLPSALLAMLVAARNVC